MIKVIKDGQKPKFRATCAKCGCIFEYEPEDIKIPVEDTQLENLACPFCGNEVPHNPENRINKVEEPKKEKASPKKASAPKEKEKENDKIPEIKVIRMPKSEAPNFEEFFRDMVESILGEF